MSVMPSILRDKSDPFSLPEAEFIKLFRLSRSAAQDLLAEILEQTPSLREVRSNAIAFPLRLLGALNFLGHGSYQRPTGTCRIYCQSQPSMSRSIQLVVDELIKLTGKYIRFPSTAAEVSAAKADFMTKLGMAGIVGAIDGTHIAIIQPSTDGHLYYNRKAHYSLNVLAACDANHMFTFADANYPGSVHDSAIWQMADVEGWMPDNAFLLGDSGFPSNRCILTPSPHALPGSIESRYNIAHAHARNIIERQYGVLKMRFRCLNKHRVLHYTPTKAGNIVYACMVLHNFCTLRKMTPPVGNEDDDVAEEEQNDEAEENAAGGRRANAANAGQRVRDAYIQRYF